MTRLARHVLALPRHPHAITTRRGAEKLHFAHKISGVRRNTLYAIALLLLAITVAGVLGVMRIYGN